MKVKYSAGYLLSATSLLLTAMVGMPCAAQGLHHGGNNLNQNVAIHGEAPTDQAQNKILARKAGGDQGGGSWRGGKGVSRRGPGHTGFSKRGLKRGSDRPRAGWSRTTRPLRRFNSGNRYRSIRRRIPGSGLNPWRKRRMYDPWRRVVPSHRLNRVWPGWERRG